MFFISTASKISGGGEGGPTDLQTLMTTVIWEQPQGTEHREKSQDFLAPPKAPYMWSPYKMAYHFEIYKCLLNQFPLHSDCFIQGFQTQFTSVKKKKKVHIGGRHILEIASVSLLLCRLYWLHLPRGKNYSPGCVSVSRTCELAGWWPRKPESSSEGCVVVS